MEWWMFRSLALKERPAKTGETVVVWPLGRYSRLGAMMSRRQNHGTLKKNVSAGEGPKSKRASLSTASIGSALKVALKPIF